MALSFSLLSIGPRLEKRDGQLIARTCWRVWLAFLGSYERRLTVDPKRQNISIFRRYLWFFRRTKEIPFHSVKAVLYRYTDVSGNTNWAWWGQTYDHFTVGLQLHDFEEVNLFHFFGEGTFVNNTRLPDWLFWEQYVTTVSGTQEQESRAFAELLQHMIGVPLTA
jgi:hypothetical protein